MNNGKRTAKCVSWHMATKATSPARLSGGSSWRSGTLTTIDATETGPKGEGDNDGGLWQCFGYGGGGRGLPKKQPGGIV